jgi:hypothetical protein
MDRFPQSLYRMPGSDVQTDIGSMQHLIVSDEDALHAALADGWCELPSVALKDYQDRKSSTAEAAAAETTPDDAKPPTRDELEQKANELGIKFDGRWGDKKISDAIATALQG